MATGCPTDLASEHPGGAGEGDSGNWAADQLAITVNLATFTSPRCWNSTKTP